jgi:hypothetical protein
MGHAASIGTAFSQANPGAEEDVLEQTLKQLDQEPRPKQQTSIA